MQHKPIDNAIMRDSSMREPYYVPAEGPRTPADGASKLGRAHEFGMVFCFDLLWTSFDMRSNAARLLDVRCNPSPEPVVPHKDETQRMWPPAVGGIRATIPLPS
jgi:hypothetical protein